MTEENKYRLAIKINEEKTGRNGDYALHSSPAVWLRLPRLVPAVEPVVGVHLSIRLRRVAIAPTVIPALLRRLSNSPSAPAQSGIPVVGTGTSSLPTPTRGLILSFVGPTRRTILLVRLWTCPSASASSQKVAKPGLSIQLLLLLLLLDLCLLAVIARGVLIPRLRRTVC